MQILMSAEAHKDIVSIFEYILQNSIKYAYETSNIVYIHFIVHSKRNFKSFYKSYIKNNF